MKLFYSILLLACIALKPVYFISYVGYFEVNKEYIIKKYCVNKAKPKLQCNGKCHLSKQLSFNISKSEENQFKAMLSSFKNFFTPLFYTEVTADSHLANVDDFHKTLDFFVEKKYSYYPSTTSPPPRI